MKGFFLSIFVLLSVSLFSQSSLNVQPNLVISVDNPEADGLVIMYQNNMYLPYVPILSAEQINLWEAKEGEYLVLYYLNGAIISEQKIELKNKIK